MESLPVIDNSKLVRLCDFVLEQLHIILNVSNDIQAFHGEIWTLRKFLSLIDRVFKSKLPQLAFEEQHFTSVEVLLDRCRTTFSRLSQILAAPGPNTRQAGSQEGLQETLRSIKSSEVIALRSRISFYTQTLQMSLQTVKL